MSDKIITVCEITPKTITHWECPEWMAESYRCFRLFYRPRKYSMATYFKDLAAYDKELGAMIKQVSCVENKFDGVKGLSVSHVIIDEFVIAGEIK